ncbi:MAG: M10 family metallopeptidase C-terminal domain-containing protein [Sedimentitalea sp.]
MTAVNNTTFTDEVYYTWLHSQHWAPSTLTYSFPDDGQFIGYQNTNDVNPLSNSQKAAVERVLDEIASFTNLTFTEVTESATTEGTLRFAQEVGLGGGYAYLPNTGETGGDGFFGSGTNNPTIGNEAYLFFTHEIGHAMGLDHGHESPAFVASGFDSQEYTVVTYTDYVGDTDTFSYDSGVVDWAQTYQQLDIAALQYFHGANYSSTGEVWSGDTVYTFSTTTGEMSINGVGDGTPAGNRIFRTIWDGDGEDTYDLSNYATDLNIDLTPGEFSTFDAAQLADLNGQGSGASVFARGNVANARLFNDDERSLIENAIGGSGDDTIVGNAANNVLTGNGGRDDISGEDGDDTLSGNGGKDTLNGGGDDDELRGGSNRDILEGEDGEDLLLGGGGRDKLIGGADKDVLKGGGEDDKLIGGGGNDKLQGGDGEDQLEGGFGWDRLTGGSDADAFIFENATDSMASSGLIDWIIDFEVGLDVIDLSGMIAGSFALSINGSFQNGVATVVTDEIGGDTIVSADVDGDTVADFAIEVQGAVGLTAGDFIL